MRRTIQTEHPRTLVLENVVQRPVETVEPGLVRDTAIALARDIRSGGGTPVGPLIQRLTPGEDPADPATNGTVLMRQSETPLPPTALPPGVSVRDRIEVPGCIVARFRGDASDLEVVYAKLAVHAYENDLVLDGTVHLVFVGEDGMNLAVDAFASTVEKGRHAGR
jgi:hypothetical protein